MTDTMFMKKAIMISGISMATPYAKTKRENKGNSFSQTLKKASKQEPKALNSDVFTKSIHFVDSPIELKK